MAYYHDHSDIRSDKPYEEHYISKEHITTSKFTSEIIIKITTRFLAQDYGVCI